MANQATADETATATADDGFSDTSVDISSEESTSSTEEQSKDDDQSQAEADQEAESQGKADDSKTEDDEATKKARNREMAEKRIAEREQKKTEAEQSAEDKTEEESGDKAEGDEEAKTTEDFLGKLEADIAEELKQVEDESDRRLKTIEARQYLSEAKTATNQLVFEHQQVQQIPIFNPENSDYNKDAYEYFVNQYEAAHTVKDSNGVIWPRQSLYQFMKGASDLLGGISQKGSLKGQQAEAKMRSRAEVPSGKSSRKSDDEDDPFLKGFLSK